jgi:uncharacterized protein (DUF58 family)
MLTFIVCFFYSLVADVRIGLTFLIILIVAPIFSAAWVSLALRKLEITGSVTNTVLSKGDSLTMDLSVKSYSRFILPLLRITYCDSFNLHTQSKEQDVISVGRGYEQRLMRKYTAKIWGVTHVGIQALESADFLGLIRYSINADPSSTLFVQAIEILPNIPEITANALLRDSIDTKSMDNEEERRDKMLSYNGLPGYEHREYEPGDEFKRINWKLSSRYDVYMVRMEESSSSTTKMSIVIDYLAWNERNASETRKQSMLDEERTIEAVLAMVQLLAKQHVQCQVFYYRDGSWNRFVLESIRDVSTFQYILAKNKFLNHMSPNMPERLPDEAKHMGGAILFFTNSLDDRVDLQVSHTQQMGTPVKIIVPHMKSYSSNDVWLVNDRFEFIRGVR